MAFSSLFPSAGLLCGIARVSAHDCEIEFNSHTATGGETDWSRGKIQSRSTKIVAIFQDFKAVFEPRVK